MPEQSSTLEVSRAYLYNEQNHGRFDLTQDGLRMIGCFDPRVKKENNEKITENTGGGALGEAVDGAIAATAYSGRLTTINQSLERDKRRKRGVVPGRHEGCTFEALLHKVLEEIKDPKDSTKELTLRWLGYFGIRKELSRKRLDTVEDSAGRLLEHVYAYGTREYTSVLDRLYPDHANVAEMIGSHSAMLGAVSLHPNYGYVRPSEDQQDVQIYYDSLEAMRREVESSIGLTTDEKGFRFLALVRRSAALATLLPLSHPGGELHEIRPIQGFSRQRSDRQRQRHLDIELIARAA